MASPPLGWRVWLSGASSGLGESGQELVALAEVDGTQSLAAPVADGVRRAQEVVVEGVGDGAESPDGRSDLVVGGPEAGCQGVGGVPEPS